MKTLLFQAVQYIRHFFLARRKGHGIHSRYVYDFLEQTLSTPATFHHFSVVEKIRRELATNHTILDIDDHGAGSKTMGRKKKRKISELYASSCSPAWKSEQWFRILNFLKCRHILELGTNLGINALTLSGLGRNVSITTIEGCSALANFAASLSKELDARNILVVEALFDDFLRNSHIQNFDAVVIDGNHSGEALLRYATHFLSGYPFLKIIIADDIYWSEDMYEAWKKLSKTNYPNWIFLDAFHYGLILKTPVKEGERFFKIHLP